MVEVIEDTFHVESGAKLVVSNEVGDVDVVPAEDATIDIRATLDHADRTDYRVRQEGGTVYVKARKKSGLVARAFGKEGRVDIAVKVPKRTEVDLGTVVGDLELRDVVGASKLSTVNGQVMVHGVEGELNASVVNGRLALKDVKGRFEASTVNGGIEFEGEVVLGSKNKLSTVNGGVHVVVQGRTRLDVEASTVNGSRSIGERATEDDRGEAHLQVSTVNGSIKVE